MLCRYWQCPQKKVAHNAAWGLKNMHWTDYKMPQYGESSVCNNGASAYTVRRHRVWAPISKTKQKQTLKLPTLALIEILMINIEIDSGNQQLNIKSSFSCTVEFPSQALGKMSGNWISNTLLYNGVSERWTSISFPQRPSYSNGGSYAEITYFRFVTY